MLDNSVGGLGVGPKLEIVSARVHYQTGVSPSNCTGFSATADLVSGIEWAVNVQGARVLIHSWALGDIPDLENKYAEVRQKKGVIPFAAAGNQNSNTAFPCRYDSVVCIGGIDVNGNRWVLGNFGSNHDEFVDFVAPAAQIVTTDRSGSDGFFAGDFAVGDGGTSHATPMAAGVAALMIAEEPLLQPDTIERILVLTIRDLGIPGKDDDFGHGLIDASAALDLVTRHLFSDTFEDGDVLRWSAVVP